jgi:CCR4-NOT transcription complex subunit 1
MSLPPPGLGGGAARTGPPPGFGTNHAGGGNPTNSGGANAGGGGGGGGGGRNADGQGGTAVIVRAQIVFLLTTLTEDTFEKASNEIRTVSIDSSVQTDANAYAP